ncbi:hypothetical protein BCS42_05260 [Crenothrix sp. D3]|nr:hypothetical protein BCS42_05260 [Crenothrix sp. D3]
MNNVDFFEKLNLKRISVLLGGLLMMTSVQAATTLDAQLKLASGATSVIVATSNELQTFNTLLKPVFMGTGTSNWQVLAMQQVNQGNFITLQELPTAKNGRGFFAINTQVKNNRLLQAPHSDTDLNTGKIVSSLFLTGGFKAAQWNTVRREISDMAHTPDTYWQAFTKAFAEQYPDGKIIQLHGYEQTSRVTDAAVGTDIIVSAGHKSPPPWVQQTAACLKKSLSQIVALYPIDVQELGGTTNVQGQLLQRLGHQGFLHIEMTKVTRQALVDNADLRNRFMSCL